MRSDPPGKSTSLAAKIRAFDDSILEFVGAIDAVWEESLALLDAGHQVPAAWISTARQVFGGLLDCPEDVPFGAHYRWAAASVSEHMRYFEDMDLAGSSVWSDPETREKRDRLLRNAAELLDSMAGKSEEKLREELEQCPFPNHEIVL